MKDQILFSGKTKKYILSSSAFVQRVVNVNHGLLNPTMFTGIKF